MKSFVSGRQKPNKMKGLKKSFKFETEIRDKLSNVIRYYNHFLSFRI